VPNAADIKRTYSPPIPTAITSEYFQAPRSAGLKAPEGFGDDEDEGGMVTGGGSNDTVGPTLNAKRRRRKEILEEDDSSDLSDEKKIRRGGKTLDNLLATLILARQTCESNQVHQDATADALWLIAYTRVSATERTC
jgi:hypothetical protein